MNMVYPKSLSSFYRGSAYLIFTLVFVSTQTFADASNDIFTNESDIPQVSEISLLGENFLSRQRQRIDALTRSSFGQSLANPEFNMSLLQRIIDENLIPSQDTTTLQALGVVLGDIFVAQVKDLHWQTYEDEIGASHAVCIKNSEHCLFPITMLSRRLEAGIKPNVVDVYNNALQKIKPYLPKLPYQY